MRTCLPAVLALAACSPGLVEDGGGPRAGDAGPGGKLDEPTEHDGGVPYHFTHPENPFGIGLVGPGSSLEWDRTAELTGPGGHVKLIFPGIDVGMPETPPAWIEAVQEIYARDLIPVVRMGPHWGDRDLRSRSDDAEHLSYPTLAAVYAQVAADLPRREGWPLILEIHNEANLCYEWACDPADAPAHPAAAPGWLHYTIAAREYAAFLRDTADAIHALGDPRILVTNGGLAPGGTIACECGGEGFQPGITGLDFLEAMLEEVPDLAARLDGWASHPYPASGIGHGFFVAFAESTPGLTYHLLELATLEADLPVYVTETGWTVEAGAMGSREHVASWMASAFAEVWLGDPHIAAVMPFLLYEPFSWQGFAWLDPDGQPYPVFDAVRDLRCALEVPAPCEDGEDL